MTTSDIQYLEIYADHPRLQDDGGLLVDLRAVGEPYVLATYRFTPEQVQNIMQRESDRAQSHGEVD